MGGTIVCGLTRSAAARDAAELGAALAARLGMRLVLVHVSQDGDAEVEATPGAEDVRFVHGSPAEAIADVAAEEGADLIVLGSRAGGLRRRLLRSGLARLAIAVAAGERLEATVARNGRP